MYKCCLTKPRCNKTFVIHEKYWRITCAQSEQCTGCNIYTYIQQQWLCASGVIQKTTDCICGKSHLLAIHHCGHCSLEVLWSWDYSEGSLLKPYPRKGARKLVVRRLSLNGNCENHKLARKFRKTHLPLISEQSSVRLRQWDAILPTRTALVQWDRRRNVFGLFGNNNRRCYPNGKILVCLYVCL